MIRILIKRQVSESSLMRVCQLSFEDPMFHQMDNYSYFLLEFGRKLQKVDLNTVHSFIARTFWKNQLLYFLQMESLFLFASFVLNCSRKHLKKLDYLQFLTTWFSQLQHHQLYSSIVPNKQSLFMLWEIITMQLWLIFAGKGLTCLQYLHLMGFAPSCFSKRINSERSMSQLES